MKENNNMISDSIIKRVNSDGSIMLTAKRGPLMDLYSKGCAVPDPIRVTYNSGTKTVYKTDSKTGEILKDKNGLPIVDRTYPILTTIVNWATGEKTVVQNSEADGLSFNADGSVSTFSKECGFVFALAKRVLVGKIYKSNASNCLEYHEHGFGAMLNKIVDNACDQQKLEAQRKAMKKVAEKNRLEAEKRHAAKVNASEPSLRQCVKDLSDTVAALKMEVSGLKSNTVKKSTLKSAMKPAKKSAKKSIKKLTK